MKIYKLKFTDEKQWLALYEQMQPKEGEVSIFGSLPVHVNPTTQPEWIEGEDKPDPIPIEGYHIDVILSDGTLVQDYIVNVDSPQHSFTGCTYPIAVAVPTDKWLKADIQQWLTDNGIEWDSSMLKAELLNLI